MGKRIPLFISTLTMLSGLVPASLVGAASPTGPWSFDELMAAKNEVEAEANTRCTNAALRSTCINQIMEEKGGIYYTGLWKFQFNQLAPISMNFATGELEYYYNSTNEYRKFNNKKPYLRDFLTELLIVQVEQGYDNWAADLKAGVKGNDHWRMLYYGVKGEEEDSLIDYDRKTVLNITPPSSDPKYEKSLRIFQVKSLTDESEIYTYDFSECAEGRKCEAWYDASSPNLYFKDFNYSDGLNAGYDKGYNEGYQTGFEEGRTNGRDDGYNTGYEEGYRAGQGDGYESGYNDGENHGYNTGHSDGYDAGYSEGHQDGYIEGQQTGYTEGRQDGYDEGRQQGYAEGHEAGQTEGYQNGFDAGLEAGRTEGYQSGHSEGYEAGYSSGYEAGLNADGNNDSTDTTDTTNVSDITSDQEITNDSSNNSSDADTQDNKTKLGSDSINQPSLKVSSALLVKNTNNPKENSLVNTSTLKNGLISPNTGRPTMESGSTEFPWWLVCIVLLNISVLIWLFWPNAKKSKKTPKKPIDKIKKLR